MWDGMGSFSAEGLEKHGYRVVACMYVHDKTQSTHANPTNKVAAGVSVLTFLLQPICPCPRPQSPRISAFPQLATPSQPPQCSAPNTSLEASRSIPHASHATQSMLSLLPTLCSWGCLPLPWLAANASMWKSITNQEVLSLHMFIHWSALPECSSAMMACGSKLLIDWTQHGSEKRLSAVWTRKFAGNLERILLTKAPPSPNHKKPNTCSVTGGSQSPQRPIHPKPRFWLRKNQILIITLVATPRPPPFPKQFFRDKAKGTHRGTTCKKTRCLKSPAKVDIELLDRYKERIRKHPNPCVLCTSPGIAQIRIPGPKRHAHPTQAGRGPCELQFVWLLKDRTSLKVQGFAQVHCVVVTSIVH